MPQWTEEKPLRVATGFTYVCGSHSTDVSSFYLWYSFCCFLFKRESLMNFLLSVQLGPKFMKDKGIKHVSFSTADGALEAAPAVRDGVCFIQSYSFVFSDYKAYI